MKPAEIFLVKVTTPKTMAPNNKTFGIMYTKYAWAQAIKENEVTISEFVPGNLKPTNIPRPIAKTIIKTTVIELKNLANK